MSLSSGLLPLVFKTIKKISLYFSWYYDITNDQRSLKETVFIDMCIYRDVSWNENDLLACSQAASIILPDYGVDILIELDDIGCFGSFYINSLINN